MPPFDIRELIFDGETYINATDARRMIIQDLVQQVGRVLKKGMIGDEQVQPSDIAILADRSAGSGGMEAFRAHNLPAVVFTDVSLFSSPEAKEILGYSKV